MSVVVERLQSPLRRFVQNHMRALSHADFRWYWLGQCISMIGRWMQTMALAWLVMTLTPSPFWLGVAGSVQFLPLLLLTLPAGAIIDRSNKKQLIIVTQFFLLAVGVLLGTLALVGSANFWIVLVLGVLLSCGSAFDMPARHAYFVDIVGKEDVRNAVALNSATFNMARMVGPAVAGLTMKTLGAGWCLMASALSLIPVILSLFMIRAPGRRGNRSNEGGIFKDVVEGLRYIRHSRVLLTVTLVAFVVITMTGNHNVLMPLLARDRLGLNESGFGLLMSSLGIGAIFGALFVSFASKLMANRRAFWASAVSASLATAVTGVWHGVAACAVTLVAMGFLITVFTTITNSTLQVNSDDAHRGRVVGMYILIYGGTAPFGNLLAGSAAHVFGAGGGWVVCGMGSVLLAFVAGSVASRLSRKAHVESSGAQPILAAGQAQREEAEVTCAR